MARGETPRWDQTGCAEAAEAPTEYPIGPEARTVFQKAMRAMNRARVPYAVGGAFGLHWYTGSWRVAKDLDFFVLPEDVSWACRVLQTVGFTTTRKHPEWLAQAYLEECQVDLIYGMGNWLSYVDRPYLEKSRCGIILGVRCWILAPEEMIYSKAFVASRERYDAADIYHLLVATQGKLDWERILSRFGEHWEVLLSHLIMFRWVYPSHRDFVPAAVLDELLARFERTRREPWTGGKVCRGFLLDGIGSYAVDVQEWGYEDARERARENLKEQARQRGLAA